MLPNIFFWGILIDIFQDNYLCQIIDFGKLVSFDSLIWKECTFDKDL